MNKSLDHDLPWAIKDESQITKKGATPPSSMTTMTTRAAKMKGGSSPKFPLKLIAAVSEWNSRGDIAWSSNGDSIIFKSADFMLQKGFLSSNFQDYGFSYSQGNEGVVVSHPFMRRGVSLPEVSVAEWRAKQGKAPAQIQKKRGKGKARAVGGEGCTESSSDDDDSTYTQRYKKPKVARSVSDVSDQGSGGGNAEHAFAMNQVHSVCSTINNTSELFKVKVIIGAIQLITSAQFDVKDYKAGSLSALEKQYMFESIAKTSRGTQLSFEFKVKAIINLLKLST